MKYFLKTLLVLAIACVLEFVVFNFSAFQSAFFSNNDNKVVLSQKDFTTVNWSEENGVLVSGVDPQLISKQLNTDVETVYIKGTTNVNVSISLFYKVDGQTDFTADQMVSMGETALKPGATLRIGKKIDSMRIDLGENAGLTLSDLEVCLNYVPYNFSIARIIAVLIIYWGSVGLFALQKSKGYEIHFGEKQKDDNNEA